MRFGKEGAGEGDEYTGVFGISITGLFEVRSQDVTLHEFAVSDRRLREGQGEGKGGEGGREESSAQSAACTEAELLSLSSVK